MEVTFIRVKKVMVEQEIKGKKTVVEENESYEVPFETHPCELLHSLAKRFAASITPRNQHGEVLDPPPGMTFSLRRASDDTSLSDNITVKTALREGTESFALQTQL